VEVTAKTVFGWKVEACLASIEHTGLSCSLMREMLLERFEGSLGLRPDVAH
jgi:hypothetical protein